MCGQICIKEIFLFFVAALTEVKMLDCSNNQLSEVPASLSNMAALEQLYLRHNKLRHLPHLRSSVLKVPAERLALLLVSFFH